MRKIIVLLLLLSFFGGDFFVSQAQKLVQEEVNVLKVIAQKLNKQWNFSIEPCSKAEGWVDAYSDSFYTNNLTCNCINTSCNVIHIELKGQNLAGELPAEMANLTQLNFLDLTRNYLNGTIPVSWASLPLTNLSLLGNRVSGRIPKELGQMITLQNLELRDNQMEGPIPASLNKLINLKWLYLSGNNFSGELPDLGNLKNITFFLIDGNPISGKIPGFIGNWTMLQKLHMQGTSLEGPFPPTFVKLSALTELAVSDWTGGDGKFPPLQNMLGMKHLYLRNLSISGSLPDYIGNMDLKVLDLSFNKLTGAIPTTNSGLQKISYMYLTGNMLGGTIPDWILQSKHNLDISYNNFTGFPAPQSCGDGSLNLVSSYSFTNNSSILTCLRRNQPCSGKPTNYNLFINCGGNKVTIGKNEYEDDSSPHGPARYASSVSGKWSSSSTGSYMDNENNASYTATNASVLLMPNQELYTTARLSPVSLRYHGLCLQKGNYNVSLHFAEIMFTDDKTYFSVGRRLFDVSIQGKKVLHDFNIAKEANGTAKEIIKTFATDVDDTLEIHFQWLGKGTSEVPRRNVYGPLISAISVTPNFKPDTGGSKLSIGAILGIVAAVCIVILLLSAALWFFLRRKNAENSEFRSVELQTGHFSLRQIKAATRNFNHENKIGEGGFGPVYKGVLPDGSEIAVKQLSSKSKQGNREFLNEIGMISAVEHPNLVKLYGCCIDGSQLLVVYEYLENNSLARALFGPEISQLNLDWETRRKICLGIAKGLTYLHEESRLKIVHRDIKATNVLLDKHLNAKISDFGLAKLDDEENTHISTRIAGTVGYMAPEYAMRGHLTDKADVYSFGVVLLEILSGKRNYRPKEKYMYLLDWAYVLEDRGTLLELVDPKLGSNYSKEEALQMLNLALICTNPSPTRRPLMSAVVSMLDGKLPVGIPSMKDATVVQQDTRFKSFEKRSHDSNTSTSNDDPWTSSSGSQHTRAEGSPVSEIKTLLDMQNQ